MAAFFKDNISALSETSGMDPENKAAAEGASPTNVSYGNSSLEPEDTDIHLLYLSKRAALHGRKRPKPRSGPAVSENDGCSSVGTGHFPKSPEFPVNIKKLKKANKENLGTVLELLEHSPSRSQQHLSSWDLLSVPSANRNDASKTSAASLGFLPEQEASPAFPEKAVSSPRI